MLESAEVEKIWADVLALAKPWFQSGLFVVKRNKKKGAEYPDDVWPEFYPGFNASVDERESLRAHIEPGFFPERLYKYRAPNSTDKELDYIRANHKQVTLPVYSDCENTILRGLNDQNWSIDYAPSSETENESQQAFKKYVTEEVPEFSSLLTYVKYVIPRLKMMDPMGVILNMPETIPTIEGEAGLEVDPSKLLEPVPQYFPVTEVWGYRMDEWYLIRSREKSLVQFGNKTERTGLVMYLVDNTNIWRIEQTGRRIDLEFNITQWFEHGLTYPPCMHLMGNPCVSDGRLRWQSPYLAARESLDIVLLDNSYLNLSKATGCFPYRVMLGDECDFEMDNNGTPVRCRGGQLSIVDAEGHLTMRACPSCKDTPGLKSRLSPAGVMLVKPGDALNPDGETKGIPTVLQWVSPAVDTLQFLRDEMYRNTQEARKIMHLSNDGASMPGGTDAAKTATQSGIDQRGMYAFVGPIIDQVFTLFRFLLDSTGGLRYGAAYTPVELRKPTSFDIRTEADIIEELKNALSLPPAVVDTLVWSYVKARFAHDARSLKTFETIAQADALFSLKASDIATMKADGTVEPWQVVLHFQAVGLFDQLSAEGKLTGDVDKDAEAMRKLAQNQTPEQLDPAAEAVRKMVAGEPVTDKKGKVIKMPQSASAATAAPSKKDPARTTAMVGEFVADTALNGAQVTALANIIIRIAEGTITKESAKPLILAGFPGVPDSLVDQMIRGAEEDAAVQDPAPAQPAK